MCKHIFYYKIYKFTNNLKLMKRVFILNCLVSRTILNFLHGCDVFLAIALLQWNDDNGLRKIYASG